MHHIAIARGKSRRKGAARKSKRVAIMEELESRLLLSTVELLSNPSFSSASAYSSKVLATFDGLGGYVPESLFRTANGNLYGVATSFTGTIVFQIDGPNYAISILASSSTSFFTSPSIVADDAGDIFGETGNGILKIDGNTGNLTLITVAGLTPGLPVGNLSIDSQGNVFGFTYLNGSTSLVEIPSGENVMIPLTDSSLNFTSPLISDSNGDLFGEAVGPPSANEPATGLIFELPTGSTTISIVATLGGVSQGHLQGDLAIDQQGDIFATVNGGGTYGDGAVFELPVGGASPVLIAAFDASQGYPATNPIWIIADQTGNIFGEISGENYSPALTEVGNDGEIFEIPKGSGQITPIMEPDNDQMLLGNLGLDDADNLYAVTTPRNSTISGLGTVYQLSPTVASAAASHLIITQEPLGTTNTDGILSPAITIHIEDQEFSALTSDNATITASLFQPEFPWSALEGTTTVTAVDGVATFNDLSNPNPYDAGSEILFTDQADDLTVLSCADHQADILEHPTASHASQLSFIQQPSAVASKSAITPTIEVAWEDQYGNIPTVGGDNVPVYLKIASGPSGSGLIGDAASYLEHGIATFNDVEFSVPGTYTLMAMFSGGVALDPIAYSQPLVVTSQLTPDLPTTCALGPADSAAPGPVLSTLTPTYAWETATDATGYGLYIEDTSTGQLVYPDAQGVTATPLTGNSFTLPAGVLQNGHQYKWYMTSFVGAAETTTTSAPRYFQTPSALPTNLPNLVPEKVTLSKYSSQVGQTITVDWTMANTGTAEAAPTVTGIRWGTSSTSYLGMDQPALQTPAIPAGASIAQSTTITIPVGASAGTYYIWVIADNSDPATIAQSNISDDFAVSKQITVSNQFPISYVSGEDFAIPRNSDLSPGTANWSQELLVGSGFAYIKATQDTVGDFLPANMSPPNQNIAIGVYDFADPTQYYDPATKKIRSINPINPVDPGDVENDAKEEADFFYQTAKAYLVTGYLMPALDLEYSNGFGFNSLWTGSAAGQIAIVKWVNAWTEELDAQPGMADIKPILYMNTTFAGILESQLSSYRLWVTLGSIGQPNLDPTSTTWTPSQWNWAIEQYQFSGASSPPDLDILNPALSGGLASLEIGQADSMANIGNVSVSTAVVTPSGNVTITYTVNANGPMTLLLGASLEPSGGGSAVNLEAVTSEVTLVAGSNTFSEQYTVPSNVSSGAYDLLSQLWLDVDGNGQIDAPPDVAVGSVVDTQCALTVPGLVPLMTAVGPTWNQNGTIDGLNDGSETWNAYTPQYIPNDLNPDPDADRNVTGCVATAVAQVLYYWKEQDPAFQSVPVSFTDSGDAYWYTSYAPDNPDNPLTYVDADSSLYDFLPFQSTSGESLDSALAGIQYNGNSDSKALLSFAVGVEADMQYGPDASSASVGLPLLKGLGFESAQESNDWGEIESTVVSNIADGEPVVAAIYDNKGNGHCVVIDGYDPSSGLFHVDLGWGPGGDDEPGNGRTDEGTGDWYALSSTDEEINAGGYDFTSIGAVLYDINPTLSGPARTTASLGTFSNRVQLSWEAVPAAVGYQILRNTADDSSTAIDLTSVPIAGNSYDDTTAVPGETYYYWVQPESAVGPGELSTSVMGSLAKAATTLSAPSLSKPFALGAAINIHTDLTSGSTGGLPFFGTVTIADENQNVLGMANVASNGSVNWALTNIPAGTYECTASYAGDSTHAATESGPFTIVVNPAPLKVSLKGTLLRTVFGQANQLTATIGILDGISIQPTGTVTFWDGSTMIGQVSLDGSKSASLPISSALVGKHKFTASYSGDPNFVASKPSAITVKVQKDKVVAEPLEVTPGPIYVGQPFDLTAAFEVIAAGVGIPAGQVTFKDGSHVLGSSVLQANGTAVLSVNLEVAGSHKITAVYAGDSADFGVTAHALLEISKATTNCVLIPSTQNEQTGRPVTFTATVTRNAPASGTPTGIVLFKQGTKVLGRVSLTHGVAAWTTSKLPIGSIDITAVYLGSRSDDPIQMDAIVLITV